MKNVKIVIVLVVLVAAFLGVVVLYKNKITTNQNPPITSVDQSPSQTAFNSAVTLGINQQVTFTDGLVVTLTQINDSRCKIGVVCIWAGELSPNFSITGGNVAVANTQFILGTTTKKKHYFKRLHFYFTRIN